MELVDAIASVIVFSIALSLLVHAAIRIDVDYYASLKALELRSKADAIIAAIGAGISDYEALRKMFPDVGFAVKVEYPSKITVVEEASSITIFSDSGSVPVEVHVFAEKILNYTGLTPLRVPYKGGVVVAVSPYGYAVYGASEGSSENYDYVVYFNGRGTGVCTCKSAYEGPKVYLSSVSYWAEPRSFEHKPHYPFRPLLIIRRLVKLGNWTALVTIEIWPRV